MSAEDFFFCVLGFCVVSFSAVFASGVLLRAAFFVDMACISPPFL